MLFAGLGYAGEASFDAAAAQQADRLVKTHEFPVFPGYSNTIRKADADAHAKKQYELFKLNGKKSLTAA